MNDLISTPSTEAQGVDPRPSDELAAAHDELDILEIDLSATRTESAADPYALEAPAEPDHITFVGVDLNSKYRIIRPIGKGGMGTIFLAEHVGIGKRVAIKLLASKFSGNDAIIRRFEKEARSAARVRHKNIVEIYDCDRTPEGLPFFAMELLTGIDIRRMLKRDGPIEWPRALHLMRQICTALDAAHSVGVVHRDMKPGNVFVVDDSDEPDLVKVVDFGIAKVLDNDEDQELTHTGMVMGTAHYMSPEQARSERLDHRADVYSAGIILFQMLTGELPFVGKGFMGTLSLHLTDPVPSIRAVALTAGIDLPLSLEPIVQKVLAKDPDDRYQSALEFSAALDEIGVNPRTSLTQTMTFQATELRKRIQPTWIAAGITGVLALALSAGYMAMRAGGDEKTDDVTVAHDDRASDPQAPAATIDPPPVITPESEDEIIEESTSDPGDETDSAGDDATNTGDDAANTPTNERDDLDKIKKSKKSKKKKKKTTQKKKVPPKGAGASKSLPDRPSRDKGISSINAAVKACSAKGWLPGQSIKVKIVVSSAGAVTRASTTGPIAGSPLARCIEKAVRKASFQKSSKGDSFLHAFRR